MENDNELNKLETSLINRDFMAPSEELLLSYRFQQYSLYLQLADKISERRQNANSFFLSINTGACALIGYLFSKDAASELRPLFWCIPVAGILLSYFWLRLVNSYKQLNTGKFEVVHQMERTLPFAPYKAEWIALGEGKDRKLYYPLTHLERWIPCLFMAIYIILIFYFLLSKTA